MRRTKPTPEADCVPPDCFNPGDEWPRPIDEAVGEERRRVQNPGESNELVRVTGIPDATIPAGIHHLYMTRNMKRRLTDLASAVVKKPDRWSPPAELKLRVQSVWDGDNRSTPQHREGRLADLSLVKAAGGELDEAALKANLALLAVLCVAEGFEYVSFVWDDQDEDTRYVHAAVPRDPLCSFRPSYNEATARNLLQNGWLNLFDNVRGLTTVLIDGPDVALHPIPLPRMQANHVPVGDIILMAAAKRGLSPKADFVLPEDRINALPTVRLLPSPVADLSFLLRPVKIDKLELSLRPYADDDRIFDAENETLKKVLERLTAADRLTVDPAGHLLGPYKGIAFRIHDVLKAQPVTIDSELAVLLGLKPTLTRILDVISLAVHAQWSWSGPGQIDVISRPYAEYIARP